MRKYVIERDVPGIGGSTDEQFCEIARTSNGALAEVGPGIEWLHSYVAGDKTFCVYMAEDEESIMEHARISGFPANRITEVLTVIDPGTADG